MIPRASRIAIRSGFSLGVSRLARRSTGLLVLLGAALAVTGALIERRVTPVESTDRALEATFAFLVPLVTFALVAQLTGRIHLADRAYRVARFGVARRDVALGLVGAGVAFSIAASAGMALFTVLVAGEGSVAQQATEVFTTSGIAALSAAAYAAWFSFGATFWSRGSGRFVPLALDFALRGSAGALAFSLPRAHVDNLLGVVASIDVSPRVSSAALAVIAVALSLLASLRCGE